MTENTRDPADSREDELLAIRCQLGEPAALDRLIDRWHTPLWSYLRRMTGEDEAAELLQDVWLRVLRSIPRLRDPSRLRAWLFGIAHRVVMDRLRARYASPLEEPADLDEVADGGAAGDGSGSADELEAMHDELARLPVVERDTLTLFYLRELSLAEVADVQAVPVGTVKSRLHRARRLLRERLTERGYRDD